jgi:hypothetical protein
MYRNIFGFFYHHKRYVGINFDKKLVWVHFGRFFPQNSSGHPAQRPGPEMLTLKESVSPSNYRHNYFDEKMFKLLN